MLSKIIHCLFVIQIAINFARYFFMFLLYTFYQYTNISFLIFQGNIKALQNTETISYQQQPEVKTSPPVMGSSRPIISKKAIATMDTWYQDNLHHPYPTFTVIANLATQTGLKEEQVKKWFANKRNRRRNVRPYIKKQKTLTKTLVTQSLQWLLTIVFNFDVKCYPSLLLNICYLLLLEM